MTPAGQTPEAIPNQFHFVFGLKRQFQPFHLVYYLCLASCLEVNRPERVYFYYHYQPFGRYWDLIKERLVPIRVGLVPEVSRHTYGDPTTHRFRYAHHADFVRLERLCRQGGVYADIDTIFVNPIPPALFDQPFVIGREDDLIEPATGEKRPSLCNAFLMSARGSAFARAWLKRLPEAFDGSWSAHSCFLPQRISEIHPEWVHVEPSRTFYKHMWTEQGLDTLLCECDRDFDGVVSMHLWAHLWWHRQRNDFTAFHAGLLTEDYIRSVDTTYTIAARPFLPGKPKRRGNTSRSGAAKALAGAHRRAARVFRDGRILARKTIAETAQGEPAQQQALRRLWLYRRFKARTAFEQGIIDTAAQRDEYGMARERMKADDVVIDVGAHIGTFSFLAFLCGSRRIYSYEPEVENFRRLSEHLHDLPCVHLHHLGVFRSDTCGRGIRLLHSGYAENTGAGCVLLGGDQHPCEGELLGPLVAPPQRIDVMALDDILAGFERVELLKLDCEGSEFPILLTSHLLHKVRRIVGEYHEIDATVMHRLSPEARIAGPDAYEMGALAAAMTAAGFRVTHTEVRPGLGLFDAVQVRDRAPP